MTPFPMLAIGTASPSQAPLNFMEPAGYAARRIADFGGGVLILFCIVAVAMWVLLLVVSMRRRGSLQSHDTADSPQGFRWVLIGGFAIPTVILTFVFVGLLHSLAAFPMDKVDCGVPSIRVVGHQWWFDAEYINPAAPSLNVHSPTELHIPVGQPVDIEVETADVIHSMWVPKLHGKIDLVPGQKNHLRLVADAAGTYFGECAEFCGAHHANMRLLVVAQDRKDFDDWLAHARGDAAAPADEFAERGRALFENNACASCHTVRGSVAHGSIGPDLTHVASRARIAGGMLPNDPAHLEAWVAHAQSFKPGAQMPDLNIFGGEDLRAVVAYLETLK